jgi:hypothetical protein
LSSPDLQHFIQTPYGILPVSTPKSFNAFCSLELGSSAALAGFGFLLLSETSVFLRSCELRISSALRNIGPPPPLRALTSLCLFKLRSAAALAGFGFFLFLEASVGLHPCGFRLSSVPSNFSFRTEVSHSPRCFLRSFGLPANLEISISTSRDRDLVVANQARVIVSQDIFMSTKKFTFMKKNFKEKFLCAKKSN